MTDTCVDAPGGLTVNAVDADDAEWTPEAVFASRLATADRLTAIGDVLGTHDRSPRRRS